MILINCLPAINNGGQNGIHHQQQAPVIHLLEVVDGAANHLHALYTEEQLSPKCHRGLLKSVDVFFQLEYHIVWLEFLKPTWHLHLNYFAVFEFPSPCGNAPLISMIHPCQSAISISICTIWMVPMLVTGALVLDPL